jgi:hypothetical protein
MLNAPALIPISSGESIPGELLLSRAHFRFDSIAKFETLNYIYKLLKKAATYTDKQTSALNLYCASVNRLDKFLSRPGKLLISPGE